VLQIVAQLQRARIVRLERGRELIQQPRLLADLAGIVAREALELLRRLGARPQRTQMVVIRPEERGQDPRIEGTLFDALARTDRGRDPTPSD